MACSTFLLQKDELLRFNKQNAPRRFLVIKDIYPHFTSNQPQVEQEPILRKGAIVSIVAEQESGWLKVRAFLKKERREQSQGRVVLYVIHDFLRSYELPYTVEQLQEQLAPILREISQ